jgi:outer membrane autotransporter protein
VRPKNDSAEKKAELEINRKHTETTVSNHTQAPGRPSALFKRSSISTFLHSSISYSLCTALALSAAAGLSITAASEAAAAETVITGFSDFDVNSNKISEDSTVTLNSTVGVITSLNSDLTLDGRGRDYNFTGVTREWTWPWYYIRAEGKAGTTLTIQNFGSFTWTYDDLANKERFRSSSDGVPDTGLSHIDSLLLAASSVNINIDNVVFSNIGSDNDGFISLKDTYTGTARITRTAFIQAADDDGPDRSVGGNAAAIQYRGGNLILENTYFEGFRAAVNSGQLAVTKSPGEFIVKDSVFKTNEAKLANNDATLSSGEVRRGSSGGAIGLLASGIVNNVADSQISGTNVSITHSYFYANTAWSNGGALAFMRSSRNIYVSDSYFAQNSSNHGGDIAVDALDNTVVTVRDSEFYQGNEVEAGPSSLYVTGEEDTVLNVIAENKNTLFTGSRGKDISIDNGTVNFNAAEGQTVSLHEGAEGAKSDGLVTANINKPVSYTYTSGYDEAAGFIHTVAQAPVGGEIAAYGPMSGLDIHAYGGTLRLLPADTAPGQSAMETVQAQAVPADGNHYLNASLLLSQLTVENDTYLKTQKVEPITHEAYTAQDEAALMNLTGGVELQTVILGNKLSLKGNLLLEPAVDLTTATADNFMVGDGNAEVTGNGKLIVAGWIVKADRTENAEVRVSLTPDGENSLGKYFGLADTAKIAYGPIYVWNVRQTEGTSEYIFYKEKPEEALENPQSDVLTTNDETEPEAPLPEIPSIVETPKDFNPDVYAEQVASLGTSVVQHAISNTIFGEEDAHRLEALLLDEKPERKEWWGKVIGSDLTIESKNFYDVDMYYLVAMIGHQFEPVKTSAGTFEFGAYLGAVNAREKYSVSKVQQNGAFLGGSVYWQAGGAWLGAHTNIGIMSNELTSISENRMHNPWIGVGATAGYAFPIPRYRMLVSPVVDFGYVTIRSKNYTTNLGASVKNSSLHSFEVSPGLRIDKVFDGGWKVQGEAHYVVVSKHSGKASASYADGDSVVLPRISNRNYVEYGLGIRKQDKNWGFAAKVTRSDAGHRGWAGMARVSYRF